MSDLTLVGIAGGLRKGAYSRGLLNAAQELVPDGVTLEIAEIRDFPLFNQDDEASPPEPVRRLKEAVRAADAVLFSLNEHNYGLSAAEKNALDWGSRPYTDNVWNGKPAGMMSASVGTLGGVRAQYALRQSMVFLNMFPINRPEVLVGSAAQKFDASGRLTDETSRKFVRDHLTELVRFARLIRRPP